MGETPSARARWLLGSRQKMAVGVVALLLAGAAAAGLASAIDRLASEGPLINNDFAQDYISAEAWLAGRDPYELQVALGDRYRDATPEGAERVRTANPHPPAHMILVIPFALLPVGLALGLWIALDIVALVTALWLVLRQLQIRAGLAGLLACTCLALPVVHQEVRWGQSNGFLLLLLVLGWRMLSAGRPRATGMFLGVATALKLFPVFLLAVLIRSRAFRAARWHLGSAVMVSLVGSLVLGWQSVERFVTRVGPENFEIWRSAPWNISLVGLPYRWLSESIWRPEAFDSSTAATMLAVGLALACVAAALCTGARISGDVFMAAVPWMILASPLAWGHYLVLSLPLVVVTLVRLGSREEKLSPVLLVVMALMIVGEWPIYQWHSAVIQVMVYGLPTYALLAFGISDWRVGRPTESLYPPSRAA